MKNILLKVGVPVAVSGIAIGAVATSIVKSEEAISKDVATVMNLDPLKVMRSEDQKTYTEIKAEEVTNEQLKDRAFGELKHEDGSMKAYFLGGVPLTAGSEEAQLPGVVSFDVPSIRYYNDYFSILVDKHGIDVYGKKNLEDVIKGILDNFPYNTTPATVGQINLVFTKPSSFMSAKGGVMGNTSNGLIAVAMADNMKLDRMQDTLYYVLQHELQHVNTMAENIYDKNYSNALIEPTSHLKIGKPDQFQYAEETGRGDTLKKLELDILKKKTNYATFDNIDLSYIPRLKGRDDLTGLSGTFASEVTHLYQKPIETIVEDMLEETMPLNNFTKRKYGENIGGVLGSISYRMSHGVSLANNPNRNKAVRFILRNSYVETGYQVMSAGYAGGPLSGLGNKQRIYFESTKTLDDMGVKLVDSTGKELKLKTLKTRMFARDTVLADRAVEFTSYINSFILDMDTAKSETYHFEYKTGVDKATHPFKINEAILGGDSGKIWRPTQHEIDTMTHEQALNWVPHTAVLDAAALKTAGPIVKDMGNGITLNFERNIK